MKISVSVPSPCHESYFCLVKISFCEDLTDEVLVLRQWRLPRSRDCQFNHIVLNCENCAKLCVSTSETSCSLKRKRKKKVSSKNTFKTGTVRSWHTLKIWFLFPHYQNSQCNSFFLRMKMINKQTSVSTLLSTYMYKKEHFQRHIAVCIHALMFKLLHLFQNTIFILAQHYASTVLVPTLFIIFV